MVSRLALLSLVLAVSCTAEPSDLPIEPGERCSSFADHCVDDESILQCTDRTWTIVDCVDDCGSHGAESLGCEEREGGDRCSCGVVDFDHCPMAPACLDDTKVRICDEDGMRVTVDCFERCGALVSLGCTYEVWPADCQCTHDGLSCDEEGLRLCDAEATVARCEGGVWQIEDCADACGGSGGAGCDPFAEGGAACVC